MTPEELCQEAIFSDNEYIRWSEKLDLNLEFYLKYAEPKHDWDWRQFGAKLLGDVRGKKILDYGCGLGEEAVYLAKMGAHVTAIDISPVGVQSTIDRARHNGVADRVTATVMRGDPTSFPAESFDLVHGFGILHHVGLEIGLNEVRRVLKPGGKALFFEHMGNIEWIERLKTGKDHTDTERPLRWQDVLARAPNYRRFVLRPFHLLTRLRFRVPFFGRPTIRRIDHVILTICPPLRHFASGLVIYLEI